MAGNMGSTAFFIVFFELFSLEILHRKSGSMATLRRFRQAIKELVASNDLPDYRLTYDDKKDVLKVRNRDWSKFLKKSP